MKLTKAQYDALPEGLKALYKATGEDTYEPTFVTSEDHEQSIAGLKKKNEELIGKDKASRTAAEEAERKRQEAADEAARKAGDVQALEASWQKKLDDVINANKAELESRDSFINQTLVDAKAHELATTLGGKSAAVLMPHIKPRLTVEKGQDGKYSTRILDADGKPSALTIEDLGKEFRSNEAFAGIITTPTNNGLGGGLGNDHQGTPIDKGLTLGTGGAMMARAMELAKD